MNDAMLTRADVAKLLGNRTKALVDKYCRLGRLPYTVTPSGKMFNPEDVDEFIRKPRVPENKKRKDSCPSSEWLDHTYKVGQKTRAEIAALVGVHPKTVYRWMKRRGIRGRNRAEAAQLISESGKRSMENHWHYKGGQTKSTQGYVYVLAHGHPGQSMCGYVRRSRLVMEKHLGRFLRPGEIIHHRNEIKDDDRLENLLLTTNSEHIRLHNQIRKEQRAR